MRDPAQKLRDDLTRVQSILKQADFITLTSEEKNAISAKSEELLGKLDSITHNTLVLGIIGGTGVGKSSLMNALAGSVISSTSHRRPHTDSILIYRHQDVPFPSTLPLSGLPWHEFTHTAESVQQILLCDLPDFDSLLGVHRQRVIEFLQYLDALIWVTSPEKYADGRFYEFMRLVPKAKQNFYFVLNKTDIFFDGKPVEEAFEELSKVTTLLQEHLRENGIESPPLYTLSATEGVKSGTFAHWNQFPIFRQEIFQQRNIKEIKTIKGANLEKEVEELLTSFDRELVNIDAVHRTIGNSIATVNDKRSESTGMIQETASVWIQRLIRPDLTSRIDNPSILIGPAYGFYTIAAQWRKYVDKQASTKDYPFEAAAEQIAESIGRQLERLENQTAGYMLREGIPVSVTNRLENIINAKDEAADVSERLQYLFEISPRSYKLSPHYGFRLFQYSAYFVLFLLFIFALAGEGAWQKLFQSPGVSTTVNFLVTALYTIFSPTGLAALGSFALISIFFGYRIYRRYGRLIEREVDRFLTSLKEKVGMIWEKKLDTTINKLTKFDEELRATSTVISDLKEKDQKGNEKGHTKGQEET